MEIPKPTDIAAKAASVTAYVGQITAVFHNYTVGEKKVTRDLQSLTNLLDTSAATFKQFLPLLESIPSNVVFSPEGLKYIDLLIREIAILLVKIQPAAEEACLPRQERRKLDKEKRKARNKGRAVATVVDTKGLKLDEKTFLETVEKADWDVALDELSDSVPRLYELQIVILLVTQVGNVAKLLGRAGKVDVQSLVVANERVLRTAKLAGIKMPQDSKGRRYRRRSYSSSDSSTSGTSSSDSESIVSDYRSRSCRKKRAVLPMVMRNPPNCPPKVGPWNSMNVPSRGLPSQGRPQPGPLAFHGPVSRPMGAMSQLPPPLNGPVMHPGSRPMCLPMGLPSQLPPQSNGPKIAPGWRISGQVPPNTLPAGAPIPVMMGAPSMPPQVPVSMAPNANPPTYSVSYPASAAASIAPEKQALPEVNPARLKVAPKPLADVKTKTQDIESFEQQLTTFASRLKTFFLSKNYIAGEIKQATFGTETQLTAFLMQRQRYGLIPHSALHSVEGTHPKTLLAHGKWYDTYKTLSNLEIATLNRILRTFVGNQPVQRELVALTVLQENRLNAWFHAAADAIRKLAPVGSVGPRQKTEGLKGRLILAICREKLVNGMSIDERLALASPPPHRAPRGFPGPPPPNWPNLPPPLRAASVTRMPPVPGQPSEVKNSRISDLTTRLPPFSVGHPPTIAKGLPEPPLPPISRSVSIKCSGMSTPPDVAECKSALTSYREWTVRLLDAVSADKPRNWARSMVTEESSGHETIEEHIKEYEDGNNVIDAKLGLSAVQNAQVTKILEDIKLSEHDVRFEWCWAEISLYSDGGTYSQLATSADIMYLVAKRTLKPTYHPQDIYHALLRGQALPPRHPAGFPGPPGPPPGPPPGWRPLPPDLRVVHGKLKKSYSSIDSDTDFNTDSTSSIVGPLQQKVNRFKCRSPARRPVNYSSDSDSDAQDDALKFDLDLKKGDSIVQKLLDRWTVNEPAND